MSYKARFLYNVFEEKYAINPYYTAWHSKDPNWHLGDEYIGVRLSPGYKQHNAMRYVRLKEEDVVFYEEELNVEFEVGNRVKVDKETFNIIQVIKHLDGSIDYHTDKIETISLNTKDTCFDERHKKAETETVENVNDFPKFPERPKGTIVYENFTGTEKEHKFWKKLFK